jgi:hypothetical protein
VRIFSAAAALLVVGTVGFRLVLDESWLDCDYLCVRRRRRRRGDRRRNLDRGYCREEKVEGDRQSAQPPHDAVARRHDRGGDVLIGVGTPEEIRRLEDYFAPREAVAR